MPVSGRYHYLALYVFPMPGNVISLPQGGDTVFMHHDTNCRYSPCPFSQAVTFYRYVVVNFLSRVFFVFLLFLGMLMYANEVETKEK